jgi:hypothetical protein
MAATEIQIPGTTATAKVRSIWVTAILAIVTIFIYFFFWYYFINREMKDFGKARGTDELGDSPGKSLLAVTLGALVVIPALVSLYNTGKRIQAAQRLAGVAPGLNGWLALVMYLIFSPVMVAYFQNELNKVWEAAAAQPAAVTPPPPPAPAV